MNDRTIIRELLEIELDNFAFKLGLVNADRRNISYQLTLKALNLLSEVAKRDGTEFNKQIIITLVSLLWTHADKSIRDSLRQIMTPVLSSAGFSPSNTMLDSNFKASGVYSPLNSYIDKLRVLVHDHKNEISIGELKYTLTSFQKELWVTLNKSRLVGISAPTSAGKSYLIYLKIIDLLHKGKRKIVYVVPTLSLISQVTSDLSKLITEHSLKNIDVLNSYEENLEDFIYVVTQERAIALFSNNEVSELSLLVVDEIQNIERVTYEGEDRSKILYDVLIDVRNDASVMQIILSGPRLKDIGDLGFRIFGEISDEKQTQSSPVLNLTYSISSAKENFYLNLYSGLFDSPLRKKIDNTSHINGLGQVKYTDKFNHYLNRTLDKLGDEVNVVFSPTPLQARKSAESFSQSRRVPNNQRLRMLARYFRDSVHSKYELASFVESGVAYHTGKTPLHVRKSIEHATSLELIRYLFCTTTLMQGINLPAKNVVIRNPNLFTQKRQGSIALSSYEFANLRGRAGRLLTDFIGRTIVLDEGAFENTDEVSDTNTLFPDEYKEIKTGYQEIYSRNSEFVDEVLYSESYVDDAPSKALITHIRQVLYKHGPEVGQSRLKDVGLDLSSTLVKEVMSGLEELNVERDFVLSNRYWDPLDLERLQDIYLQEKVPLPNSAYEAGMTAKLLHWISLLQREFPYYFARYFGNNRNPKYLYSIAKSAESWVKEIPLCNILESRLDVNDESIDEKIDAEIEKLTKHVSFGLPMLLKPVADLGQQESNIISVIELGMYTPLARYLSDRGVPRETAIKVSNLHKSKTSNFPDTTRIRNKLNYWELQHVLHLI